MMKNYYRLATKVDTTSFGYEKLIPLFKAAKWDPDGLVKFFKESGARFIMPVATHHDNFDMVDSSFPWIWITTRIAPPTGMAGMSFGISAAGS